jgi:L-asparagine transporter-like permease
VAGILALLAVLISTRWLADFRVALPAGAVWLAFVTLCYFIWRKFHAGKDTAGTNPVG